MIEKDASKEDRKSERMNGTNKEIYAMLYESGG